MEETMTMSNLPKTDSIKELAAFWDTHDVTDFEDELEEVTEIVFERKSSAVVEIHLQSQEAESIERVAKSRGISQEALVREWVLERLHRLAS